MVAIVQHPYGRWKGKLRTARTPFHVAVRQAAVRGAHEALPHLTSAELAVALGFTRHQVRHYLLGDLKAARSDARPAWTEEFFAACRALACGQPGHAAEPFERLARELFRLGRAGEIGRLVAGEARSDGSVGSGESVGSPRP